MDLVKVGHILGPHGVDGHLKVLPSEGAEGAFESPAVWSIGFDAESVFARRVEGCRRHVTAKGTSFIVRLDGLTDRTAAERLKGAAVFVSSAEAGEIPAAAAPTVEGYSVVTGDGSAIGAVVELRDMPAQDLLVVRRRDGTEVMIPWVPEFVHSVDHDRSSITMVLPEGLVE